MATYQELRDIYTSGSDTLNKCENAVAEIMTDVLEKTDTAANGYDDTNHAARLAWVVTYISAVRVQAKKLLWPVLVANKNASKAAIEAATVAAFITNLKPLVVEYTIGLSA